MNRARILFKGRRRPLDREALHEALDAAVAARVTTTCRWDKRWVVGDYRFAVFSIEVAPRTQVYVQLWSEPLEPVLCEVSSGRWNPPADTWLAGDRSSRIEALGFDIGGGAENFQQEFKVASAADARKLARLIVDVMYAGFDYRALQDITAQICHESRAEPALVVSSVTPEDLTKIFEAHGYSLTSSDDDEDAPVLTVTTRGVPTTVTFGDRVPDQRLFTTAVLSCEFPSTQILLQLDGGVTTDWLSRRVAQWTAMIVEHQRQIRRSRRSRPPALSSGIVH